MVGKISSDPQTMVLSHSKEGLAASQLVLLSLPQV
jgi:hypothetical protein